MARTGWPPCEVIAYHSPDSLLLPQFPWLSEQLAAMADTELSPWRLVKIETTMSNPGSVLQGQGGNRCSYGAHRTTRTGTVIHITLKDYSCR